MCLDGEKNDRVAFQARADYQNHAIGWLHRGYGIVKLTDRRLFSPFLHEAKPLKLRRAAIDNLPRFRSESG